jgi:hypothetical protein
LHEEGSSITPAKKVSQTNPRSRWTAAPGGPAYYAYSTNYLVDTEASIIVDVEATPAHRTQEVWSTQTRIEPVKEHFPEAAKKLIGDTAYGTAEFLSWMVVEQGIEPHGPVWDKGDSKHDRFGRTDFRYDEQADSCTCPGGIPKDGFIRYRASLSDCSISSMKALCSPNTRTRKVVRSQHENVRDVVRAISQTTAYQRTRRDRKKVNGPNLSKMNRIKANKRSY